MNERERAEAEGFNVDTNVYPWFAYKGPRFAPTEHKSIHTDLECRVIELEREKVCLLRDIRALPQTPINPTNQGEL